MNKHPKPKFAQEALSEFDGCDSNEPGSPEAPAVWLFGIEFGQMPDAGAAADAKSRCGPIYSVQEQLGYRYNQKAFKLLAAMNEEPTGNFRDFAARHHPFVRDRKSGYFKGNLYPYACRTVKHWPEAAEDEVGLTKSEYQQWCDMYRIPTVHGWVNKYQPKVFIGVGLSASDIYSRAVFGTSRPLEESRITASNGQVKRLLSAQDGWRKLVVIPHLTGGSHGLNSDDSIQKAGAAIKLLASFT